METNSAPSSAARPKLTVLTSRTAGRPHNFRDLERRADVVYTRAEDLAENLEGARALLLWDFFSTALRDAWDRAGSLEWVHVAAAGVDSLLFDGLRESDVTVTNAHGAFDEPIAEFVLASVLAHDKQLHLSERLQRQKTWRHRELRRTAGRRALVVGTGGIGRGIAHLLRAVGLEVRAAGRTAREEDPDFGTVVPSADLAEHVGWADHVVLIAPLTEGTRGLVDARVLAAMQPSAHLINVGRGALVDEPALVDALRERRIAAASLDVFAREPLPEDHPFWELDNVHVSAHMSGDVMGWREVLAEQFSDNLGQWLAGQPLRNVVDKRLGYVPRTRT